MATINYLVELGELTVVELGLQARGEREGGGRRIRGEMWGESQAVFNLSNDGKERGTRFPVTTHLQLQ